MLELLVSASMLVTPPDLPALGYAARTAALLEVPPSAAAQAPSSGSFLLPDLPALGHAARKPATLVPAPVGWLPEPWAGRMGRLVLPDLQTCLPRLPICLRRAMLPARLLCWSWAPHQGLDA